MCRQMVFRKDRGTNTTTTAGLYGAPFRTGPAKSSSPSTSHDDFRHVGWRADDSHHRCCCSYPVDKFELTSGALQVGVMVRLQRACGRACATRTTKSTLSQCRKRNYNESVKTIHTHTLTLNNSTRDHVIVSTSAFSRFPNGFTAR